jgi:gliding motility-associated-like protein
MKARLVLLLLLSVKVFYGQSIIDSCFSSVFPSTDFTSSPTLANMSIVESDMLQWTGTAWVGGWPGAGLTIPPPTGGVGCKAIFIGNASTWTTGGEGFGLQINAGLIAGQSYTYNITSVSHGTGSTGSFNPAFHTNNIPSLAGSTFVGNLTPVGFTWATNAFTFTATPAQNGHNWIIITTAPSGSSGLINNFCTACNFFVPSVCNVNLGNDTTLCSGNVLTLNATVAGATYVWQNNSTNSTFQVTQSGTYWVSVTDGNGCVATDTIVVAYNQSPGVNLGNDTVICTGDTLLLDATTPNTAYLWQNNTSDATFLVTQPGTYWVTVTTGSCSRSDTVNVGTLALPLVNIGNDTTLCDENLPLVLNATSPNSVYSWSDNSSNPTLTVNAQGEYWVTVSNNCGSANDTVLVTSEECDCYIYIPNAFSPNGDENNNQFGPASNCAFVEYTLLIYNRWGEKLYETSTPGEFWDGTYQNAKVPVDVYVYVLIYRVDNFQHGRKYGSVTVIH